ncbi:UNVERIFIED_CONTAM: hypothetical protein RMT77_000675 [Armadillidium vulgare]
MLRFCSSKNDRKFYSAKLLLIIAPLLLLLLFLPFAARGASLQNQSISHKSSSKNPEKDFVRSFVKTTQKSSHPYLPFSRSFSPTEISLEGGEEEEEEEGLVQDFFPTPSNSSLQLLPTSRRKTEGSKTSGKGNLTVQNKASSPNGKTLSNELSRNFTDTGSENENDVTVPLQSFLSSSSSSSYSQSHDSFLPSSQSPSSSATLSYTDLFNDSTISSRSSEEEINGETDTRHLSEKDKKMLDVDEKSNKRIVDPSNERMINSKKKTILKEKIERENEVKIINKNDVELEAYKMHIKSPIQNEVNNKLQDRYLLSMSELLSKNLTERLSEIISLRNKPQKFLSLLKIAQQSDNFEDPFSMSPYLREKTLDNLLATDSSAFNEGQKKLYQSSFRGLSNEQYKSRRNESKKGKSLSINTLYPTEATNTFTSSAAASPTILPKSEDELNKPVYGTSENSFENNRQISNNYDADILEVSKKFQNEYTRNANKKMVSEPPSYGKKVIYEEISENLHIDTSIDDIKDDYKSQQKPTENTDQYIPPVNTSRINVLQPQLPKTKQKSFQSINDSRVNTSYVNNINPDFTTVTTTATTTSTTTSTTTTPKPFLLPKINTSFDKRNKTPSDSLYFNLYSSKIKKRDKEITNETRKSLWAPEINPDSIVSLDSFTNGSKLSLTKNDDVRSIKRYSFEGLGQGSFTSEDDENNNESKEDRIDKYYSFFGFKEQFDNRSENSDEEDMSTLDHNDMILNAQAERMLQVMNSSVDPCENFYEYACGRWSEVYPLEDKALDNTFDRLREGLDEVLKQLLEEPITSEDSRSTIIAKTLYKGCMDEEKIESLGVTPLKTLLSQLGGWPVLEGEAWNEEGFDWVELMAKLRKYNNDILLSEWVGADVTNSSNHIIQLDQPILGLPGREYFMSAGDQDYRMAYMELMLKTCELLGVSPEKALQDMINVLQFEKQLAKILTPAEERRNLSAVHRRLTIKQLQEEIPQIDWFKYFHIIMSPSLSPPSLTSSESSAPSKETEERHVIVFAMKYIRKLVTLIQETSKRTVSNYLMWRFVKNRMNNLGKASQDAKQDFIQILFGSKSQPERWLTCVSYVNGNLGYVLGSLFVKKYYPQTSKKDSEKMIELIRESFVETIYDATWMDETTRNTAIKKVDAMVRNVGYPEYILNNTYMDYIYSQLDFNESDHFWNVIKMLQFHALSTHDLLSKPVSRIEWTTTPAVVNAYYSRSKNMIMFPAGILQPPFYHPAFPRCLNFGGIGVVIGHEISHGFDDNGRQFDEFGNLQQWWTDEDVSHFYDRATCMLDQYSNYKVTSTGLKINAVNTLGENIADNAGLKIAYKAYQKWKLLNGGETIHLPKFNLTHNQFFFLNFGQIWCEVNSPEAMLTKIRVGQHSPNKYRVIGTLSNSKEFSEAFNCPEKSTMNPKEKCQVW